MKRILQLSVIIMLILVVAGTVAAMSGSGPFAARGEICPTIGWNTKSMSCTAFLPGENSFAFRLPVEITPNVGWNS
jgi:hypothetical protein